MFLFSEIKIIHGFKYEVCGWGSTGMGNSWGEMEKGLIQQSAFIHG